MALEQVLVNQILQNHQVQVPASQILQLQAPRNLQLQVLALAIPYFQPYNLPLSILQTIYFDIVA
jgi:hypothetical protein